MRMCKVLLILDLFHRRWMSRVQLRFSMKRSSVSKCRRSVVHRSWTCLSFYKRQMMGRWIWMSWMGESLNTIIGNGRNKNSTLMDRPKQQIPKSHPPQCQDSIWKQVKKNPANLAKLTLWQTSRWTNSVCPGMNHSLLSPLVKHPVVSSVTIRDHQSWRSVWTDSNLPHHMHS